MNAKKKNLICNSDCPCVKDSYNDCPYPQELTYSLIALEKALIEERKRNMI